MITWEYRADGNTSNFVKFTVAIGTVVEDTTDIFVNDADGTPRNRGDRKFVLDGKNVDGTLRGHFLVDQDDGTQKRVDIVRTCHHIRLPRKCCAHCMAVHPKCYRHDAPLYLQATMTILSIIRPMLTSLSPVSMVARAQRPPLSRVSIVARPQRAPLRVII